MQSDTLPGSPKHRWPRGQKFVLSTAGEAADLLHRETVNGSRGSGRSSLDAALLAWATPLGVKPTDGVLLGQMRGQRRGFNELASALETSGIEAAEVKAAVERLVAAGLAEPAPVTVPSAI